MIGTKLEQSRHLVEWGIDPKTADMYYGVIAPYETSDTKYDGGIEKFPLPIETIKSSSVDNYDELIPAWSFEALWDLMPRYIEIEEYECRCFFLNIWKISNLETLIMYSNDFLDKVAAEFAAKDIVEAAYKMVVWLKENKYI